MDTKFPLLVEVKRKSGDYPSLKVGYHVAIDIGRGQGPCEGITWPDRYQVEGSRLYKDGKNMHAKAGFTKDVFSAIL